MNGSSPPPPSSSLLSTHPPLAALLGLLVLGMILCTLVGNCMVCLAVVLVRKLKAQPSNLLLVSLAVADFSVGLFVMPVALVTILEERWVLGECGGSAAPAKLRFRLSNQLLVQTERL